MKRLSLLLLSAILVLALLSASVFADTPAPEEDYAPPAPGVETVDDDLLSVPAPGLQSEPELAADPQAVGDFLVEGGELGIDYSFSTSTKTLTILTDTEVTISNSVDGATDNRIFVAAGVDANIILAGVDINTGNTVVGAPLGIADDSTGNVTITLKENTKNYLFSGFVLEAANYAGLEKNGVGDTVGKLTIKGSGALSAVGHSNSAGIGGSEGKGTRNIEITGEVTIEAKSENAGAGIGGGREGDGMDIKFSGGSVIATASSSNASAGIGGGMYGKGIRISITDGNVTAKGAGSGAGIGGGLHGGCEDISISGGVVNASSPSGGPAIGRGGRSEEGSSADCTGISISGGRINLTTYGGAAIGSGINAIGDVSDISITGGVITATCLPLQQTWIVGQTIGRGFNADGTVSNVKLDGDFVLISNVVLRNVTTVGKGIVITSEDASVYGSPTITEDVTIPATASLYLTRAQALTIAPNAHVTNLGSIYTVGRVDVLGTMNNQNKVLLVGTGSTDYTQGKWEGNAPEVNINDLSVSGGISGTDYIFDLETLSASDGGGGSFVLKILSDTPMTITSALTSSETTTERIKIADGVDADITLDNVRIACTTEHHIALDAVKGGAVTLRFKGDNNYLHSSTNMAGITTAGVEGSPILITDIIDGEPSGGTLTCVGGLYAPGIGGGYDGTANYGGGSYITIESGTVVATSTGNKKGEPQYTAGIGGGENQDGTHITILGGTVTATGGYDGAGIGGGKEGSGSYIIIKGGTVNANGGKESAGIGGGKNGSGSHISIEGGIVNTTSASDGAGIGGGRSGTGSDITITNGTVTATGGKRAAGIGGGRDKSGSNITIKNGTVVATGGVNGAGIGGGNNGVGSVISIEGGKVTAYGGYDAAGIGGGRKGNGTDITISGGEIILDQTKNRSGSGVADNGGAGIGGGSNGGNGENISIEGGSITITSSYAAAGIGGGYMASGNSISIKNADVNIICTDDGKFGPAAIGGGAKGGNGSLIEIVNSTVVANANKYGAGIGGGSDGNGSDIVITNSTVTATSLGYGAGIGGGYNGSGKNITINGGVVKASGGIDTTVTDGSGAGIGGGAKGDGENISISNANVTALSSYGAGIGGGYGGYDEPLQGNGINIEISNCTLMASSGSGLPAIGPYVDTDTLGLRLTVAEKQIAALYLGETQFNGTQEIELVSPSRSFNDCLPDGSQSHLFAQNISADITSEISNTSIGYLGATVSGFDPTTNTLTIQDITISFARPMSRLQLSSNGTLLTEGTDYTYDSATGNITINAAVLSNPVVISQREFIPPNPSLIPGTTHYPPVIDPDEADKVTVDNRNPSRGDEVTITVKPDEGKEVDEVVVKDRNGNKLPVDDNGDGTYSYTQPAGSVTIEIIYKDQEPAGEPEAPEGESEIQIDSEMPFIDVPQGEWYYEDVQYVYALGLMNGTDQLRFSPQLPITRGMIVTILYRLEGSPAVSAPCPFDDVLAGSYYESAITWAAENGIVEGYGNGKFGPDSPITREQLAAILYRYAAFKGYNVDQSADLTIFADYDSISDYALVPMAWANSQGLINGTGATTLNPGGQATRAQAAAALHRFCETFVEANEEAA